MIKKEFKIESKKIGTNNPVYFIADIAANHDGDLNRAKDLIYLAAEAGADAAKFQHFKLCWNSSKPNIKVVNLCSYI